MMDFFIIAFQCAVVGYVYSEILIKDGHILHGVYKFFESFLTWYEKMELPNTDPEEIRNLPGYAHKPVIKWVEKKHWFMKVIGGCPLCTSGQFALWSILIYMDHGQIMPIMLFWILQMIGQIIFTICASIWLVDMIITIRNHLQKS